MRRAVDVDREKKEADGEPLDVEARLVAKQDEAVLAQDAIKMIAEQARGPIQRFSKAARSRDEV